MKLPRRAHHLNHSILPGTDLIRDLITVSFPLASPPVPFFSDADSTCTSNAADAVVAATPTAAAAAAARIAYAAAVATTATPSPVATAATATATAAATAAAIVTVSPSTPTNAVAESVAPLVTGGGGSFGNTAGGSTTLLE